MHSRFKSWGLGLILYALSSGSTTAQVHSASGIASNLNHMFELSQKRNWWYADPINCGPDKPAVVLVPLEFLNNHTAPPRIKDIINASGSLVCYLEGQIINTTNQVKLVEEAPLQGISLPCPVYALENIDLSYAFEYLDTIHRIVSSWKSERPASSKGLFAQTNPSQVPTLERILPNERSPVDTHKRYITVIVQLYEIQKMLPLLDATGTLDRQYPILEVRKLFNEHKALDLRVVAKYQSGISACLDEINEKRAVYAAEKIQQNSSNAVSCVMYSTPWIDRISELLTERNISHVVLSNPLLDRLSGYRTFKD